MARSEDQETARVVVRLLEQLHIAHPQIDDAIAAKWCDNFIEELDPAKYYFLKADVEEFKKEASTLDDQIKEGNVEFAKKVLARICGASRRTIQDPDGPPQTKTRLHRR